MASEKPLYQRTWFVVVMSFLLLAIVSGAVNGGESSQQNSVQPSPVSTPSEVPSETPSPAAPESAAPIEEDPAATEPSEASSASPEPSESPSLDPNSAEGIEYFIFSSNGQYRDIEKDLRDAIKRTKNDQTIRLLGNTVELLFNQAQLEALDPPTAISKKWRKELGDLDGRIMKVSDGVADYISGAISQSKMISLLNEVAAQVDVLRSITNRL